MTYIVSGCVGIVAVLVGVILGVNGEVVGGYIIGGAGGVLTAIGLVGFGVGQLRERRSPSRQLEEQKAREELNERTRRQREADAEAELRRKAEDRRKAQMRDLDRIRRAIIVELGKLGEGVSLIFAWGRLEGENESREYRAMGGRFMVGFQHDHRRSGWDWPEGGIPTPPSDQGGSWDPSKPGDVDKAYGLLQPERYLVAIHLPDDPLELPEPGYLL